MRRPTRTCALAHTRNHRHPGACSETRTRTQKRIHVNTRTHRVTHVLARSHARAHTHTRRETGPDTQRRGPHPTLRRPQARQQPPGSAGPACAPPPSDPAGCEVTRLANPQGLPLCPPWGGGGRHGTGSVKPARPRGESPRPGRSEAGATASRGDVGRSGRRCSDRRLTPSRALPGTCRGRRNITCAGSRDVTHLRRGHRTEQGTVSAGHVILGTWGRWGLWDREKSLEEAVRPGPTCHVDGRGKLGQRRRGQGRDVRASQNAEW